MEESSRFPSSSKTPSRTLARWLLTIGQNRCELFSIEMQQARQRAEHSVFLVAGTFLFCFLGLAALSALLVVLYWHTSPTTTLAILTGLYSVTALVFYARLKHYRRAHQAFAASIEQLRKDRLCVEDFLQ